MKTEGSRGNGKTQTNAIGIAIAQLVYPIKGNEEIAEGILRHALTVITHLAGNPSDGLRAAFLKSPAEVTTECN